MALELTQPLTEMSTWNFPGGKWRPVLKADNLTAICEPNVYKYEIFDVSKLYRPLRLLEK
jgi:hypothetical protein